MEYILHTMLLGQTVYHLNCFKRLPLGLSTSVITYLVEGEVNVVFVPQCMKARSGLLHLLYFCF